MPEVCNSRLPGVVYWFLVSFLPAIPILSPIVQKDTAILGGNKRYQ